MQIQLRLAPISGIVSAMEDPLSPDRIATNTPGPRWRRWVPRVVRVAVALLVAWGVGRRLWQERVRLAEVTHHFAVGPLVLSGIAYQLGLSACATFWWWSIRDQGDRPSIPATWSAYFAGHLGKYVPGKGLVVVIRAGMLRDSGVGLATGAVSCAHETLLMMTAGSFVCVALSPIFPALVSRVIAGLGAILLLVLGIPSLPPVIALWSRWVVRPFAKTDEFPKYVCRWGTVLSGFALIAFGWLLMGLSLAGVLASMGTWSALADRLGVAGACGLLTAVVALATVGGFVSFLPGGLGSREWILVEALGPALGSEGTADAAVAAIVLRVVWIVAEITGTGLFWLWDRQSMKRRVTS
jgi:uncharacterized membrane protein YbhN (UPF0104 family)